MSQLIPTHHLQPSAFFSYTAGLAGPRAGGEMWPQQLGDLKGEEPGGGEELHPLSAFSHRGWRHCART